jgi:predicted nucleic acid-binding Zn finger protein
MVLSHLFAGAIVGFRTSIITIRLVIRRFVIGMVSEAFRRGKESILKKLQRGGLLTQDLEKEIAEVYGKRGTRAVEAVKGKRVVLRGRRWFVRGKMGEYEIVKNFCTCRDYVMNISTSKADVDMCYHALAKNICQWLDHYYIREQEP